MDYAGVKIVLDEIAADPQDWYDRDELDRVIDWVRDHITIRANETGGPVWEVHSEELDSALPQMQEIRRLLTLRHFGRAAAIAKRVRALLVQSTPWKCPQRATTP
jgi:hypothetical protein